MVDYSEFMNKPLGEMKKTLIPVGHYFGRIRKHGGKESSNNKPMYVFQFALDSAGDDVDPAQLANVNISGKVVSLNCMLAEDFGQDAIGEVIRAVVPDADPAQPWGTYLPRIDNQPVKLYIAHRPRDKDDPNGEQTEDVKKVLSATGAGPVTQPPPAENPVPQPENTGQPA